MAGRHDIRVLGFEFKDEHLLRHCTLSYRVRQMKSLFWTVLSIQRQRSLRSRSASLNSFDYYSTVRGPQSGALSFNSIDYSDGHLFHSLRNFTSPSSMVPSPMLNQFQGIIVRPECAQADGSIPLLSVNQSARVGKYQWASVTEAFQRRCFTTTVNPIKLFSQDTTAPDINVAPRIKFKRLDKTARNIMQILDKEAVEEVRAQREIPDIRPGYIIQLKVEVPENKRRVTTIKGIVIARRNAGINTTFRLRRLVAGVGVESLFPLYSPNIKEMKVLEKKKVRRAKLYWSETHGSGLRALEAGNKVGTSALNWGVGGIGDNAG
ncbi:hypothetical protein Nepgr_003076 [Nepenthes gracilis]|uniref:Ribosomal protein L19 n=1 Tax=Nepenthes gracilis TaxID=150966 RepID=A0AAD3RYV9_NEPGR|nr:hypothetical protein Nepgr_003076 [Nepenthes gracilis]